MLFLIFVVVHACLLNRNLFKWSVIIGGAWIKRNDFVASTNRLHLEQLNASSPHRISGWQKASRLWIRVFLFSIGTLQINSRQFVEVRLWHSLQVIADSNWKPNKSWMNVNDRAIFWSGIGLVGERQSDIWFKRYVKNSEGSCCWPLMKLEEISLSREAKGSAVACDKL